jgi:hypothetical protein
MELQIPCPECGAVLKLPNRSLLGRKGKCPKCGHRFVLAEPEEVELELAEAAQPVPGQAARRVSESAERSAPVDAAPVAEIPAFSASGPVAGGTARLRDLNQRRRKQRRNGIIIGGLVAIASAGATWAGANYLRSHPEPSEIASAAPVANPEYLSEREKLERVAELINDESLTHGKPITLNYVPAGASIVVHLHPAELWKSGSLGEETRFCLGKEFDAWLGEQIERNCLLKPAEIKEATICVILGPRGSEPQIATVVWPVTPAKTSELLQRFASLGSEPQMVSGEQIFVGSERAYAIGKELDDEKHPQLFATAPASLVEDLALSMTSEGITSDAVRQLLTATDRARLATFVVQPADLQIHEETLFRADLRPLAEMLVDWLGKDVEAFALSLHAGEGQIESEAIVRNDPATTPAQLLSTLTKKLDVLPKDLVAAVSKMTPADVGDRKLVGRFPAMVQAVAASTVEGIAQRQVVFQTRLPERAAPNLALAGLLTWLESTKTPVAPTTPGEPNAAPATIAEKLKKPVEVDFRRTPLEDAFAFIGEETGITFDLDGDALKLAAYTRNMPQTINLGRVSGEKAVAAILKQYDKMAVVIDEAGGKIIVTTKDAAAAKGLTPATLAP